MQDSVHLKAKLRVRFLKVEKPLVFGNYLASMTDFLNLMATVSKDQHLIREGDLNLQDKMNYDGGARLSSPHLEDLLREHVPGKSKYLLIRVFINYI